MAILCWVLASLTGTASELLVDDASRCFFDSVSINGTVQYKVQLGSLEIDEDVTLHADAFYEPVEESWLRVGRPGLLAPGWRLPLLESGAVPLSEKSILVRFPWNQTLVLDRYDQHPTELFDEAGVWTGRVEGEKITLSGPSGVKVHFLSGRIERLVLTDGRTVTWDTDPDGNWVVYIKRGRPMLTASFDKKSGCLAGLRFESGIDIQFSSSRDELLSVRYPEGKVQQFRRSQAANRGTEGAPAGSGLEFLSIRDQEEQNRLITWSSTTGAIVADSYSGRRWNYDVSFRGGPGPAGPDGMEAVTISRVSAEGEHEVCSIDQKKGVQETRDIEGNITKTYFITAYGGARNRVRRVDRVDAHGGETCVFKAKYNKRGDPIWAFDPEAGELKYDYDEQGRLLRIMNGQVSVIERRYAGSRLEQERRILVAGSYIQLDFDGTDSVSVTIQRRGGLEERFHVPQNQVRRLLASTL